MRFLFCAIYDWKLNIELKINQGTCLLQVTLVQRLAGRSKKVFFRCNSTIVEKFSLKTPKMKSLDQENSFDIWF